MADQAQQCLVARGGGRWVPTCVGYGPVEVAAHLMTLAAAIRHAWLTPAQNRCTRGHSPACPPSPLLAGKAGFGAWGIFDGHGGRQVATYTSNALLKTVMSEVDGAALALQQVPAVEGLDEESLREWQLQVGAVLLCLLVDLATCLPACGHGLSACCYACVLPVSCILVLPSLPACGVLRPTSTSEVRVFSEPRAPHVRNLSPSPPPGAPADHPAASVTGRAAQGVHPLQRGGLPQVQARRHHRHAGHRLRLGAAGGKCRRLLRLPGHWR